MSSAGSGSRVTGGGLGSSPVVVVSGNGGAAGPGGSTTVTVFVSTGVAATSPPIGGKLGMELVSVAVAGGALSGRQPENSRPPRNTTCTATMIITICRPERLLAFCSSRELLGLRGL